MGSPRSTRAVGATLLALGGLSACSQAPHQVFADLARGNTPLVVILVDTLRADHLGCYGYDRPTSPEIDAFAADAVLFEHCLAQSTWTRPSTASLHTGLYPSRHGANSPFTQLDGTNVTLAEILKGRGYRTAAFGSNPHIFGGTGFDQGFDTFETPAVTDQHLGYARAGVIVDRALAWLGGVPAGEPYFLYLHLFDPHAPYDPPEPFRAELDRGVRGELDAWYMLGTDVYPTDLTAADWAHFVDLYDGEIAYADHEIGRMLAALDLDRTAVVVVADHGEELYDHGGWSHTPTLYQELVHVPLIASFPALRQVGVRAAHVDDLALQVDLVPTVLDMLGEPADPALPGSSLRAKALFAQPPTQFGVSEVDEFGQYKKAVVAGEWKYIRTWAPEPAEALFDLGADPGETKDALTTDPAELAALRRVLEEHLAGAPSRYSVAFENRSDALTTLTGLIVTERARVEGSNLVDCEFEQDGAPDWDGPFAFVDAERDGTAYKAVRFTLRTAPGDVDAFTFTPAKGEERVQLFCTLDGQPLDPERVRVGAEGERLETAPLVLDLATPQRYARAGTPRMGAGDGPYALFVWKTMDAAGRIVAPTPEGNRALEKLGYGGR